MRFYFGEVVDVNDPKKSGLVKVRLHGLEDTLREDQLKWMTVARGTSDPSVNLSGRGPIGGPATGLLKGSRVMCMMVDGTEGQIPLILCSLPAIDKDDVTKAGTTPYATKGRKHPDYSDNRLRAADKRDDPTEATEDNKTVHQHAEKVAVNAYGESAMENFEDWTPGGVQGASIGQVKSA